MGSTSLDTPVCSSSNRSWILPTSDLNFRGWHIRKGLVRERCFLNSHVYGGEWPTMTTVYFENVICGNCGISSEQTILVSTNSFGSADLDLRPPEMARSTMHAWLQMCPQCLYCAPDLASLDVDARLVDSTEYLARVRNSSFPELARRFLAWAFVCETFSILDAANSYRHAAWVCDDAGLTNQAVDCRLQACAAYEKLRPLDTSESGVTQGVILVDLLRRCGEFVLAASECRSLLGSRLLVGELRDVLEFQLNLIEAADIEAHRLND